MILDENNKWTWIILFVIIALGIFMHYKPYEYKLLHPYPTGIQSADANSRVSESEWIAENGQAYYQPSWFDDSKTNIIENDPPIALITSAMISRITGLPAYDSLYFLSVLSIIGVGLVFFLIFWKIFHSIPMGLIAAILLIYPIEKMYHYQITIGMFPHVAELMFLALTVLFFLKYMEDKLIVSLIGLALVFSFAFLSHSPTPTILMVLFSIIILYKIIRKEIPIKHFLILNGIILVLTSLYIGVLLVNYFHIGQANTAGAGLSVSGKLFHDASSNPIKFMTFVNPVFYILLLLGLASIIFYLKNKKYRYIVGMFLFMFCATLLAAYFGVYHDHATDKSRYALYLFAYPIIAMGIYFLVKLVEQISKIKNLSIFVLLALFVLQIIMFNSIPKSSNSLMTQNSYDAYVWARENIPKGNRILCLGCIQFEGLYAHRPIYLPTYETDQNVINQILEVSQNNYTQGIIRSNIVGYSDERMYWDGIKMKTYGATPNVNHSICEFDYVLFKDLGQLTPMIFNIANKMIAKNNTLIYNSNNIAIIRNNFKDGECI